MRTKYRQSEENEMARILFAIGEPTRIKLVRRLTGEEALSVMQLTEGLSVTRQGVEKHLRVLSDAGVIMGQKQGRERLYTLKVESIQGARDFLDAISAGWDRALLRLKDMVENE